MSSARAVGGAGPYMSWASTCHGSYANACPYYFYIVANFTRPVALTGFELSVDRVASFPLIELLAYRGGAVVYDSQIAPGPYGLTVWWPHVMGTADSAVMKLYAPYAGMAPVVFGVGFRVAVVPASAAATPSRTASLSFGASPSQTASASATPTSTPTTTPSPSTTSSWTPSPSGSPSATPPPSTTGTQTQSTPPTPSWTGSAAPTPAQSPTPAPQPSSPAPLPADGPPAASGGGGGAAATNIVATVVVVLVGCCALAAAVVAVARARRRRRHNAAAAEATPAAADATWGAPGGAGGRFAPVETRHLSDDVVYPLAANAAFGGGVPGAATFATPVFEFTNAGFWAGGVPTASAVAAPPPAGRPAGRPTAAPVSTIGGGTAEATAATTWLSPAAALMMSLSQRPLVPLAALAPQHDRSGRRSAGGVAVAATPAAGAVDVAAGRATGGGSSGGGSRGDDPTAQP